MASNSHSSGNLYADIGKRIRDARDGLSLTQEELAEKLGMSRTSVTNIERGRQQILVHTLFSIAAALKMQVRQLLPEDEVIAVTEKSSKPTPKGISDNEWKYIRPVLEAQRAKRCRPRRSKGGTNASPSKTH